jgi:hypothetical protein
LPLARQSSGAASSPSRCLAIGCAAAVSAFSGSHSCQVRSPTWPPPAAAPEPLQECGNGEWGVYLDHPVQVTDVDAELKGGRGYDHAVSPLSEGPLGLLPLTKRERGMDQVRGDAEFPAVRSAFLAAVHSIFSRSLARARARAAAESILRGHLAVSLGSAVGPHR